MSDEIGCIDVSIEVCTTANIDPCTPAMEGDSADTDIATEMAIIFGYGSLMDPLSTQSTMRSARNFRKGILHGYTRIFSLVSVGGIRKGNADFSTNEIAALAIRPHPDRSVKGVLFDIPLIELGPYLEREHRYAAVQIPVEEHQAASGTLLNPSSTSVTASAVATGQWPSVIAWTVVERTDAEYRSSLSGGEEEYQQRVGQYYTGQLWGRIDILPMRQYLLNALVSAYILGGINWLRDVLDHSLLADGVTTIREYLKQQIDKKRDESYIALLSRTQLDADTALIDFIRSDRFIYSSQHSIVDSAANTIDMSRSVNASRI